MLFNSDKKFNATLSPGLAILLTAVDQLFHVITSFVFYTFCLFVFLFLFWFLCIIKQIFSICDKILHFVHIEFKR